MVTSTFERIRAHVERYRISTVDAVHRLFYPESTREAAKKALNRFVDAGRLASFPIGRTAFYQIAGSPPVGSQSLWERYGVLLFCTEPPHKDRFTPAEFEEHFPEFATAPGISAAHQHYYLEPGDPPKLGRILVDNDAETARAVRKCHTVLRQAAKIPTLNEMLDSDSFIVTLLVAENTKAEAVRHSINKARLAESVQVHPIPELNTILSL